MCYLLCIALLYLFWFADHRLLLHFSRWFCHSRYMWLGRGLTKMVATCWAQVSLSNVKPRCVGQNKVVMSVCFLFYSFPPLTGARISNFRAFGISAAAVAAARSASSALQDQLTVPIVSFWLFYYDYLCMHSNSMFGFGWCGFFLYSFFLSQAQDN